MAPNRVAIPNTILMLKVKGSKVTVVPLPDEEPLPRPEPDDPVEDATAPEPSLKVGVPGLLLGAIGVAGDTGAGIAVAAAVGAA